MNPTHLILIYEMSSANSEELLDRVDQHTEGASIAALPAGAGEISQVQDRGGIRCVTAHGHPFDVWSLHTMKFIHLNGDTVTAMAAACALTVHETEYRTECETAHDSLSYKDDLRLNTSLLHAPDTRPQCSHAHC